MILKSPVLSCCLVLLSVFLFTPNTILAEGNSEETRHVIQVLFEAFNRQDTEALVRLYAEDAQLFSPGDIEPKVGRAAVRETYQDHFDHIPGVHDAVQNIVADGERGSVEFIASWDQPTETDPGARQFLKIASFITVRHGKITRDITYFDRVELAEKMRLK